MNIKIIIIKLLLLIGLLSSQQTIQADSNQKYQSLSSQEKQSACQVINSLVMPGVSLACDREITEIGETEVLASEAFALRQASSDPEGNGPSNPIELLLIERRFSEKGGQNRNDDRLADAYTYNYDTDTLNHTIINLGSGQALQSEKIQRVQLPLTENEINRSKTIASTNQALLAYLEKEYLKITGQPLHSLDQLNLKAFIFLAESMPGQVNEKTQTCGLHRCARLVMHTSERIALETAPIIDLSTGIVSQYRIGGQ